MWRNGIIGQCYVASLPVGVVALRLIVKRKQRIGVDDLMAGAYALERDGFQEETGR